MLKWTTKLCAIAGALLVASSAQAVVFQLGVDVTFAAAGNPIGAVVGTTANAGTADTSSQTVVGLPEEFLSLNPAFDAAASLALTVGNIQFGHEDDIEALATNTIPAIDFQNGVYTDLDLVVIFEISGTSAIGEAYNGGDLGQDTSHFLNSPHYWADFFSGGGFQIGLITGFSEVFDEEDQETILEPDFDLLVQGTVSAVPEPSLAILTGTGLLAIAVLRRR